MRIAAAAAATTTVYIPLARMLSLSPPPILLLNSNSKGLNRRRFPSEGKTFVVGLVAESDGLAALGKVHRKHVRHVTSRAVST